MSIEPYAPPPVPDKISPEVRRFLEEELARIAYQLNNMGGLDGAADEDITGQWDFIGDITAPGFATDADGGTDVGGTYPTVKIGGGGFTGGFDGTLHVDETIGAGEANEYLLLLTSNGSIRFAIQRDGDVTFTRTLQIPKILAFGGQNTKIEGNASSYLTIHTHNGTERVRVDDTGFHVRAGHSLRVLDALNTDYRDDSHNGTDFKTDFVNTADWNIDNLTGDILVDGDYVPVSSDTTGGSGSAGSGSQYIELEINGAIYKVLHDGTV